MKNNEKEKIWNEELRKKIGSLILVFLFKIFFIIFSFFNNNLQILEKVFDYATGIIFFRTIIFDLGKIYFKNTYINSKNLAYSFIKLLLIILIVVFLIMCFLFNSKAMVYFIRIFLLYVVLLVSLLSIHIFILVCKKSKVFKSNFSKQDRNLSIVFSTLLTTTLITWFICFIYILFMTKCDNSTEIEKNSFFVSGMFSIIKEICDYLAKYAIDENVDKNIKKIFKRFKKK